MAKVTSVRRQFVNTIGQYYAGLEKELLRTVSRVGVPSDKKCLFTAVSSENVLVEGRALC